MKKEEHTLMSKKLRELLNQINGLKKEIYDLVDAGKLEDFEGDYLKNAVEAIKKL